MGSCLSADGRPAVSYSPKSASGAARKPKRNSKKNQGLDAKWEAQLHRIPGRNFINGATELASLFTQQGKKGTNQDAMIVWENFGSRTDTVFCGVFDGHGPYGHLVAKKVRDSLPVRLSNHWETSIGRKDENSTSARESMNSEDTSSLCIDDEPGDALDLEVLPEILTLKDSFLKAFKAMDKELRVHPSIDCFYSGTTAVTMVKQGQDLVIGNIGDSRAILGTRDQDDLLVAVQLTEDLKPNLPRELERIRQCKGRVFSLRDEPEVARVWLPNANSPGLAMARAFGDFCLKKYGVISVPEISYRCLTEKDEFVVLATDGIWDVLSNKEVVDIIASAARSFAARTLVESAVRAWKTKYPTSKVDDCAVVCLFLNSNSNSNSNSNHSTSTYFYSKSKIQPAPFDQLEFVNEKLYDFLEGGGPDGLDRAGTVRSNVVSKEDPARSMELELELEPEPELGDEWSAMEGVSRLDTVVTLPRLDDLKGLK